MGLSSGDVRARDIPNLICAVRILLVVPIVVLLLNEAFVWVLSLFALAGLSDGLDGFLARRFNWRSRLGAILDPLADKLLMVATYATLGWMALLPPWLVALVLLRDLLIIAGALAYHRLCGKIEMAPTFVSKFNTLCQILLVLLALTIPMGLTTPTWLFETMTLLVAATTLGSGTNYVWAWSRRAYSCRQRGERSE